MQLGLKILFHLLCKDWNYFVATVARYRQGVQFSDCLRNYSVFLWLLIKQESVRYSEVKKLFERMIPIFSLFYAKVNGTSFGFISDLYMGCWPSVRLRWLDIGQVRFCVFMDRVGVEVHKLAKRRTRPISSHLDGTSSVNKELLYGFQGNFSCWTQRVVLSG